MNMFPKRPILGAKSPVKQPQELDLASSRPSAPLIDPLDREEEKQEEQKIPNPFVLQREKNMLKEKMRLASKEKKKKARGIKTTNRIVESYVSEVFRKVKEQEDEFIENLSSPLNKDPLEILLHLQNVCLDNEFENAVAF